MYPLYNSTRGNMGKSKYGLHNVPTGKKTGLMSKARSYVKSKVGRNTTGFLNQFKGKKVSIDPQKKPSRAPLSQTEKNQKRSEAALARQARKGQHSSKAEALNAMSKPRPAHLTKGTAEYEKKLSGYNEIAKKNGGRPGGGVRPSLSEISAQSNYVKGNYRNLEGSKVKSGQFLGRQSGKYDRSGKLNPKTKPPKPTRKNMRGTMGGFKTSTSQML
jgi:hypothetical protein